MKVFETSRESPVSVERVFAAFRAPERLAKWWGPAGFTNTFRICKFKSDGRWSYVMHGPDGRDYPNESVFAEVRPLKKIIIRHDSLPKYVLTISFQKTQAGTLVRWVQEFDKEEVAEAIAHIVAPANEQNLDRLTAEVLRVG